MNQDKRLGAGDSGAKELESKKPVYVNILATNELRYLPRCLEAVKAQTYKPVIITVADNASHDGSADYIAANHPDVRLLRYPKNLYYCGGHNQALAGIADGYVLPLNADVFLMPTFVQELVAALEADSTLGQAQGKLYQIKADESVPPVRPDQYIDTTGILITRSRRNFDRGQEEPDIGQYDYLEPVFGADGSAPMYRWDMIEDITEEGQLFDPSFQIYREVVDLSWRAQARGWRAVYVPSAVGYHVRGFSPRTRNQQPKLFRQFSYRNRYATLIKNETLGGLRHGFTSFLFFELAMAVYALLRERHLARCWVALLRDWRRLSRLRRRIRARALVTNEEVQHFFQ